MEFKRIVFVWFIIYENGYQIGAQMWLASEFQSPRKPNNL